MTGRDTSPLSVPATIAAGTTHVESKLCFTLTDRDLTVMGRLFARQVSLLTWQNNQQKYKIMPHEALCAPKPTCVKCARCTFTKTMSVECPVSAQYFYSPALLYWPLQNSAWCVTHLRIQYCTFTYGVSPVLLTVYVHNSRYICSNAMHYKNRANRNINKSCS